MNLQTSTPARASLAPVLAEALSSSLPKSNTQSINARFAHDFSRVSVYPARQSALDKKSGVGPLAWLPPSQPLYLSQATRLQSATQTRTETDPHLQRSIGSLSEKTARPSLREVGSIATTDQARSGEADTEATGDAQPTSVGGTEVQTGATNCDASTGTAIAKTLNTDDCTKDCSQKHEDKHAADIGPCCAKAGTASKAAATDADKAAVQKKFDDWMIANRPRLECRAYEVSIACGEAKHKKLGCEQNSYGKCCKQLVHYISSARQESPQFCSNADTKLSECPWP